MTHGESRSSLSLVTILINVTAFFRDRAAWDYITTEILPRIVASKIADERFHFALNGGGFLFLGKAEMLFTRSNTFTPIDLKMRVFTKVPKNGLRRDRLAKKRQMDDAIEPSNMNNLMRLREAAYKIDPVAQLLIDIDGILVLANESACALFGLQASDNGRPFQDLEVSYRPIELRSRIQQAYTERRDIVMKCVEGPFIGGETKYLDVQVIPLREHNNLLGVKIIFADVTRYKKLQEELQHSKQKLEAAYEELQ